MDVKRKGDFLSILSFTFGDQLDVMTTIGSMRLICDLEILVPDIIFA